MEQLEIDILLYIVDILPLGTVTVLCRTSKAFHYFCIPKLYRTVDLTSDSSLKSLSRAQKAFASSVLRYPHVADKVNNLRWTIWINGPTKSTNGNIHMTRLSIVHQVLACLKNLKTVWIDGYTRPRQGCVIRKPFLRDGPIYEQPFPLNVHSISLAGHLSDKLLLPIARHFSSSNLTSLQLEDLLWGSIWLKYPLPLGWQAREKPLRLLTIKQTFSRDLPYRNPDYTKFVSLVALLRPETLAVRHTASKGHIRFLRDLSLPDDLQELHPTTTQQERTFILADNYLLSTFIPALIEHYERESFPKRIELSNIAPRVYASLQCIGINVVADYSLR